MTNEEMLHSLIQIGDSGSILVAQDLAIELNCGIPSFPLQNHSVRFCPFERGYTGIDALTNTLNSKLSMAGKNIRCYGYAMGRKDSHDGRYILTGWRSGAGIWGMSGCMTVRPK